MPTDTLTIEATGVGGAPTPRVDFNFEDWTSFRIRTSMVEPAEMSFELGDDTGWDRLNSLVQLGSEFQCFLADRPRMRGRIEAIDSPSDAKSGTTQRIVIRTKLSDAIYSTAPIGIRMRGTTLKQFVLACYAGVGLTENDFDFRGDVSRDIMTGKTSRTSQAPAVFEGIKDDEAKVQPGESIFAAVDRHLRRFGFLHWDGPDGKVVVAAPNDQQDPIYFVQLYREPGLAQLNNALSITRAFDVSGSPTHLGMFGKSGGGDFTKAKIGSVLFNPDLIAAGFNRRVIVIDEGLKTREIARRRANYEFAQRNRGLERLVIEVDGLSYREGSALIPWSPDCVVDVVSAAHGGALGAYYIETVEMERAVRTGDHSTLMCVRQGVWDL